MSDHKEAATSFLQLASSSDVRPAFDTYVAPHSRVRLKPDAPEIALVHIFRFEDGRVAELWDIGQPVPPDSPNEHGMF